MENKDKGLTKMGADSLAENTPNTPECVCPGPKVLDFSA